MFECGMAGCFNTAKYEAQFEKEKDVFDICQSCATYWRKYWRGHTETPPTITKHANKERELAK
jgi:hypothetical protein